MSKFAMEISDFSWKHKKYARPEIIVVKLVLKKHTCDIFDIKILHPHVTYSY